MTAKRTINILILAFIILCANSFYKFAYLGPLEKGSELLGTVLVIVLILLHMIYSGDRGIRQNFTVPVVLILLSALTSMITAYLVRDQKIIHTLFAQRALYYYFLYFLLHQMRFDTRDIENLFIFFALVYLALHFIQTFLYPNIFFNATVFLDRGTIRIYLPGSHYIAVAFLIFLQRFSRTGGLINLVLLLTIAAAYIMRGGRLPMAILVLTVVLFFLFERKVRSRLLMIMLGLVGGFAIFIIFRNVFLELIATSERQASMGQEYIRFRTAEFFLTDFFESPVAYITGNGYGYSNSHYGKLISHLSAHYGYTLGDIGIIGNYAIFGAFFVIGVLIICIRAVRLRIGSGQHYIRYYFISVILGLVLSGGFARPDFIVLAVCLLYVLDVSHLQSREELSASDAKT